MPNIRDSMRVVSDYFIRPVMQEDQGNVHALLTKLFNYRGENSRDGRVDHLTNEAVNGNADCTIAFYRGRAVALAHANTGHYVQPEHERVVPHLLDAQTQRRQTFDSAARGLPVQSPSVKTEMTLPSRALTSTMFECVFS